MYYPTDPWVYNGNEGTRYMDPRRDKNGNIVRYHMGVDSQGSNGTPIYSVLGGTVVDGSWSPNGGYGYTVVIDHGNGWRTRYAHFNSPPMVGNGNSVAAGQQVGRMGKTGTGIVHVHLHFEVYHHGNNVNPLDYLAGTLGQYNPSEEQDLNNEQDNRLRNIENLLIVPGAGYGWPGVAANNTQEIISKMAVPNAGYDYLPAIVNQLNDLIGKVNQLQAKVDSLS